MSGQDDDEDGQTRMLKYRIAPIKDAASIQKLFFQLCTMVYFRKILSIFLIHNFQNSIKYTYFWLFSRSGYYSRVSFIGAGTIVM